MEKKKEKGTNLEKAKGLRNYRRLTISLIVILLFLSIWNTMMNNLDWTFKDIITETLCLIIIAICGMYGNINNNFSLFHIRKLKMTKERLTSVLIGLFFPLIFILYVMVTNSYFMDYIKNISLHNFITLLVFALPVVIIIALIIYIGYIVIEPKEKKQKDLLYSEEVEKSLDKYKKSTLNLLITTSLVSMWIKVGLNFNWTINDITTEIVLLLIIIVMKIIGNTYNKLPWNYCEKEGLGKYFYITLAIPYILVLLYFVINQNFRDTMILIGYRGIVSIMVYILPILLVASLAIYYSSKITNKSIMKETSRNKKKRKENILISLSITIISIILLFIYILTNIIETLTLELLLQIIVFIIPVGVILYLVMYYSIKDINK